MCPYCDRAVGLAVAQVGSRAMGVFPGLANGAYIGVTACPACTGVIAVAYSRPDNDDALGLLPTSTAKEPSDLIPAPIRADLFEARKCMTVGAFKAAAAMCRRALQGACVQQGATAGKPLYQQIEEVINAAKVHASLKEWADAIRLVGNAGAHPGDDGLETVTREEADDLLSFTEQFLDLTYVVAEQVRRRLAEKKGVPV